MSRMPVNAAAAAVISSVVLSACSDAPDITAPRQEVSRAELLQVLTPAAAQSVDRDGRFQLSPPPNIGRAQITAHFAGALALALARHNLPYNRKLFDGQHGAPIEYQKLAVCGRTMYARAAFQRIEGDDPSTAAHPVQKAVGPWWLVTLCAPWGEPQLSVAVSGYATDLAIDASGQIVFPFAGGTDFLPDGIPRGRAHEELPSPEAAAVLAARLTGRLVAEVPELTAPFYRENIPQGARWRVRLDAPARIRAVDGSTVETTDVFVSRVPRFGAFRDQTWTADAVQPAGVDMLVVPLLRSGETNSEYEARVAAETRTVFVRRMPDVPIAFTGGSIVQ